MTSQRLPFGKVPHLYGPQGQMQSDAVRIMNGIAEDVMRNRASMDSNGDLDATVKGHRMLVGPWGGVNLPASITANLNLASDSTIPGQWVAPRRGSVVGLCAVLSGAAAGSALTIQVRHQKAGATAQTTKRSATIAVGDETLATVIAKNLLRFNAGDRLIPRIVTDGSWTGTTLDISMFIEVEM